MLPFLGKETHLKWFSTALVTLPWSMRNKNRKNLLKWIRFLWNALREKNLHLLKNVLATCFTKIITPMNFWFKQKDPYLWSWWRNSFDRADNIAEGFLKLYKLPLHKFLHICKSSVIEKEIRSIVSIFLKMCARTQKFFNK